MTEINEIPLQDCERGVVYRLRSRNLLIGVYNGEGGFVGVRTKLGDRYLFTEYHHTKDPRVGTVWALERLDECPIEDLRDHTGTMCQACGASVAYVEFPEGPRELADGRRVRGQWEHLAETDCSKALPMAVGNPALFAWLDPIDQELENRLRREYP